MAKSLHVIALISGGKDSFFSILHCMENGHRVVALANLFPPLPTSSSKHTRKENERSLERDATSDIPRDEMDSFMYQTVGHSLIPLYAEALDLPIYRQAITGSVVDSSRYYGGQSDTAGIVSPHLRDHDETESLVPLLSNVMAAHPDANAVCSGAILSTYQRTRIESVAIRLGLVPLSYLWQYPVLPPPSAGGLLDDMAALGFDVRLVKVASGGLADDLLSHNLMDTAVRRKVEKAMMRFGGSILGEGGEYETLVVDGPWPLWKRRLSIDETRMQLALQKESGGNASLAFLSDAGQSVPKKHDSDQGSCKGLRKIPLWDLQFDKINNSLAARIKDGISAAFPAATRPRSIDQVDDDWVIRSHEKSVGTLDYISNLTCESAGESAADQMAGINTIIMQKLAIKERSSQDIVFTTIILMSISEDFIAVNRVYGQLFTTPNPPARVTFSAPLPSSVKVMVSLVVDLGNYDLRNGLHVQSRSYWAPANIGPYSQAIGVPIESAAFLIFVAGQIPLVPAEMEILVLDDHDKTGQLHTNDSYVFQQHACLSLQHLWRIGTQMGLGWWSGAVAFVTGTGDVVLKAKIAHEAWRGVHDSKLWATENEEGDGLDVWDRTYGGLGSLAMRSQEQYSLPEYTRLINAGNTSPVPGFLAVQINQLPRGSNIEWQSHGVAKGEVQFQTLNLVGGAATVCSVPSAGTIFIYFYVRKLRDDESLDHLMDLVTDVRDQILSLSLVGQQAKSYTMTAYTRWVSAVAGLKAQIIPCQAVWGPIDDVFEELSAGIVLHS